MELIAFRVRMYKGIIDSKWVDVNNLTVLVGKNESGKTSLLRALYKFNPASSESYDIQMEWPRAHPNKPNEEQVVCQVKFQLSDQEKSSLSKTTSVENFPDTVEVSRNYAGEFEVKFKGEVFPDGSYIFEVNKSLDLLPQIPSEAGPVFSRRAITSFRKIRQASRRGYGELKELLDKQELYLSDGLSPSTPERGIEIDFIKQYRQGVQNIIQQLEASTTAQLKANTYVIDRLPTFIYMDDYRIFSGTAQLDEMQSRQTDGSLTEADRTFLTILELSELDLDELVQLGQGDGEKVTQRYYQVEEGASTLTKAFANHLRQRDYEVEYQADGSYFLTFVKDNYDSALIKLEERSKGFQWFFSFDLMFMYGSKKTFKGSVVLLDEPGVHLHPGAQKDLLCRLEEYAQGNTFIYTTHLPFMVDLNHPDRIRVLMETKGEGIVVNTDLTETSPESRFVLQAALGMDLSQKYLIEKRNLVVEGTGDHDVLTELSNLLRRSEMEGLPEDILIAAAGGASQAVPLAGLMIAQNLEVVVLFDSDYAGRQAHDKLVKKWLTRYKEAHSEVVMLGDAVGVEDDFELEDLFPEDFMKEVVKETYKKELGDVDVAEMILQGKDLLWDRIERYLKQNGVEKPNKGSVEKRLRDRLGKMKDITELPEETREKVIKLFQKIRKAFGEDESKSV